MVSYGLFFISVAGPLALGAISVFFLLSEIRANRDEWQAEIEAERRKRRRESQTEPRNRATYQEGIDSGLWGRAAWMRGEK